MTSSRVSEAPSRSNKLTSLRQGEARSRPSKLTGPRGREAPGRSERSQAKARRTAHARGEPRTPRAQRPRTYAPGEPGSPAPGNRERREGPSTPRITPSGTPPDPVGSSFGAEVGSPSSVRVAIHLNPFTLSVQVNTVSLAGEPPYRTPRSGLGCVIKVPEKETLGDLPGRDEMSPGGL